MTAAAMTDPAASGAVLRYPPAALLADYVRAGVGLGLTALPLLVLAVTPWLAVPMAAAAALFAVFGARTVRRQLSRVVLDDHAIAVEGPFGTARLRWSALGRLDLRYYSTKRDRGDGWMQLTLRGNGGRVTVDSALDGFESVAERAARAAVANGVALSPVTADNLSALGIDAEGADAR